MDVELCGRGQGGGFQRRVRELAQAQDDVAGRERSADRTGGQAS